LARHQGGPASPASRNRGSAAGKGLGARRRQPLRPRHGCSNWGRTSSGLHRRQRAGRLSARTRGFSPKFWPGVTPLAWANRPTTPSWGRNRAQDGLEGGTWLNPENTRQADRPVVGNRGGGTDPDPRVSSKRQVWARSSGQKAGAAAGASALFPLGGQRTQNSMAYGVWRRKSRFARPLLYKTSSTTKDRSRERDRPRAAIFRARGRFAIHSPMPTGIPKNRQEPQRRQSCSLKWRLSQEGQGLPDRQAVQKTSLR